MPRAFAFRSTVCVLRAMLCASASRSISDNISHDAGMEAEVEVIVNANAGSVQGEGARDELVRLLSEALPSVRCRFTDDQHDIDALLRDALANRPRMIVAGGGDGTINTIASALVGTNIVLGVLPLGTLNHFSRDLGISARLEESVATLRDGCVRRVDVGAVNGRIFLNNSGLGLYPEIVRQRERRQRAGASKWSAAFAATARVLQRYRLLTLRLEVDGQVVRRRVPAILIGNNEYSTRGSLEPYRASLVGGQLALYVPRARGRATLLWNSLRALIGSVQDGDWFEVLLTDRITVSSHHPALHVSLDGEVVVVETPLEYVSRPRALLVMAPPADPTPHLAEHPGEGQR